MKVSDITSKDVADFLRLEDDNYSETLINAILDAAKSYIVAYTGIPATAEEGVETLDDHPDFCLALLVLCQDMYCNRSMVIGEKDGVNQTVDAILSTHARNLL